MGPPPAANSKVHGISTAPSPLLECCGGWPKSLRQLCQGKTQGGQMEGLPPPPAHYLPVHHPTGRSCILLLFPHLPSTSNAFSAFFPSSWTPQIEKSLTAKEHYLLFASWQLWSQWSIWACCFPITVSVLSKETLSWVSLPNLWSFSEQLTLWSIFWMSFCGAPDSFFLANHRGGRGETPLLILLASLVSSRLYLPDTHHKAPANYNAQQNYLLSVASSSN